MTVIRPFERHKKTSAMLPLNKASRARRGYTNLLSAATIAFCLGAISQMEIIPCYSDMKENKHEINDLSSYYVCRTPEDQTVGYVCRGEEYDLFADRFERLVVQEGTSRPPSWGKRIAPFPANSITLVVGNSLTRQLFQGMACQYQDRGLIEWIDRESNRTNAMRKGTFYEGKFENGARLFLVTNHAMFYSPHWPHYLQQLIATKLNQLDALVVGHINHFMNAYNTSFMELMKEQTKKYDSANFESVSPPTLIDFANLYTGPIVGVSMMADWSSYDQDYYEMAEVVQQMDQSRIKLVHGRKYIPELGECGSNSWSAVDTCVDAPDLHRCIGERGGHPDLVLWDTLEAVNELVN